ncbi:MAG: hypothetical protein J6N76_05465 [Lachnospiraceae bacterium]|nr:hypothetical protein [Lachnospiraceae bacterium]
MNETIKNLIKTVAFLIVTALVTIRVGSVINWKESTGILKFYEYDKDQADVIFYGASRTACAINPSIMWDKYGIAAINLSEGGQNLGSTYYYMVESLKTQHPKVMVVDLSLLEVVDDGNDGNMYINTLNMKYSLNYVKNAVYEWQHSVFSGDRDMLNWLLLKFPVFHSRYKEITYKDYRKISNEEPAHYSTFNVGNYTAPAACDIKGTHELSEEIKHYLDLMMDLAEENDTELFFYIPPYTVWDYIMEGYNAAEEYVGARGYELINVNAHYRDFNFDYSTDMADEGGTFGSHVNSEGTKKITGYFTEYLHENYDLPDRRGDAYYSVYDSISDGMWVRTHNRDIANATGDIPEILRLSDADHYDTAVIINGDKADILDGKIKESGNDAIIRYEANPNVYCTAAPDKDGRFYIGRNVTVESSMGMIFVDDTSKTTNGQDIEIVVVDKKSGDLVFYAGYNIDDQENVSLAWWGI